METICDVSGALGTMRSLSVCVCVLCQDSFVNLGKLVRFQRLQVGEIAGTWF